MDKDNGKMFEMLWRACVLGGALYAAITIHLQDASSTRVSIGSTAVAARDDEAAYAKTLQVALTGLTNGGSEYFIRHGDGFRADVAACVDYVRRIRTSLSESVKTFARRAKEAETALSAERAKVAKLVEALRPFAFAGNLADGYRTKMQQKRLHDNADALHPFVPKIGDLRRAASVLSEVKEGGA